MVPGYLVAFSATLGRPLNDVDARPVVAQHVEVAGSKRGRFSAVEIARDRQRLEENFRHDHRAAEVQDDAAVV